MLLYIIRHGDPIYNPDCLTDLGHEQAKALVPRLSQTGATAAEYRFLGELYPSPGYCGEIIWMYAAKGLTFGEQNPDEDEFLSVEKIPLKEFADMVLSGEVKDAKTQAAVLKLKMLVDRGEF